MNNEIWWFLEAVLSLVVGSWASSCRILCAWVLWGILSVRNYYWNNISLLSFCHSWGIRFGCWGFFMDSYKRLRMIYETIVPQPMATEAFGALSSIWPICWMSRRTAAWVSYLSGRNTSGRMFMLPRTNVSPLTNTAKSSRYPSTFEQVIVFLLFWSGWIL